MTPFAAMILPKPSPILLYIVGLAYIKVRIRSIKKFTYLFAALDDIEGANCCVSETASENTSHHAFSVVVEVVDV